MLVKFYNSLGITAIIIAQQFHDSALAEAFVVDSKPDFEIADALVRDGGRGWS